ncbi:MAG: tRNA (adenosine(37)-N6)-threonylcarbamoyltransferase complex transferase subunit TsaD [Candidatus Omnitrophica bacterium]|nr:tRNA (adenosine(37)-N6)-threonylcarbamoyltransferase complex transferase subunit TsaD [Candidatus Omnitrophota bacterium]
MYILGIETSCDETGCSIVEDGRIIHSNVIASSLKDHAKYGGVIPEIASRRQLEFINIVVQESLSQAGLRWTDIDAFSVTSHPGLIGSLLVGISFAQGLSLALNKPLILIDHIKAHLYANFLTFKGQKQEIPDLPCIGLVVSGGHSNIYQIKDFKNFKLLGQSRDDAVGEAFDKVAKILELGYPGGPLIDKLAKQSKGQRIPLKCAAFPDSFDFSFSGIKTAVLYYLKAHSHDPDFNKADLAFSFQESIIEVITRKTIDACLKTKNKAIVIGGGVAANSCLRHHLTEEAKTRGIKVFFPPMILCTDNAAMVAGLAYYFKSDRVTE